MSEKQSIYEVIKASLVDGRLPEDFSLPKDEDSDQNLPFADGAMDGIYIYHMPHTPMTDEDQAQMGKAMACLNRADLEGADVELKKLGKMASAIASIDEFQNYIRAHAVNPNDPPDPNKPYEVRINLKNFCDTARRLIAESANKESVKFGLIICEMFTHHPDEIKEIIATLGLSDEFTIFTVWNMLNWEGGNDRIFDLIQKVRGWGRVHALERLEPTTPEIKRWILMNGTDNDVMPAYSALPTWEKSGALELLKSGTAPEEFHAISYNIDALLDEGPIQGISIMDDAEEAVNAYLDQAEKTSLNADDYDTILSLMNWADEDNENMPSVRERCDKILRSPECEEAVRAAVKEGKAFVLADALGIDYAETLFGLMQTDFDNNYGQCYRLMQREGGEYADKVIALFEEKLPLELLKGEPSTSSGLGPEFAVYSKLLFILQELGEYPGKGEALLETGLNSPVVNNRNMAIRAIKDWTHKTGQPIRQISPRLHAALYKLPASEPLPEIKADILDLLRGKVYTSEDLNPGAN